MPGTSSAMCSASQRELMADTMEEAGRLFARMQARGRAEPVRRPTRGPSSAARADADRWRPVIPLRIAQAVPGAADAPPVRAGAARATSG